MLYLILIQILTLYFFSFNYQKSPFYSSTLVYEATDLSNQIDSMIIRRKKRVKCKKCEKGHNTEELSFLKEFYNFNCIKVLSISILNS